MLNPEVIPTNLNTCSSKGKWKLRPNAIKRCSQPSVPDGDPRKQQQPPSVNSAHWSTHITSGKKCFFSTEIQKNTQKILQKKKMSVRKVAQDYTKNAYGRADWKFGKTPKYGREIRIFTGQFWHFMEKLEINPKSIWKFGQKIVNLPSGNWKFAGKFGKIL